MADGMDVSPAPPPLVARMSSSGSTPVSHSKRGRDDDAMDAYMQFLYDPPLPGLSRQRTFSPQPPGDGGWGSGIGDGDEYGADRRAGRRSIRDALNAREQPGSGGGAGGGAGAGGAGSGGTPLQSPEHCGGQHACRRTPSAGSAMCLTPMAGAAASEGTSQAGQLLMLDWGSIQRQGPRSVQQDSICTRVEERHFPHAYFGVFDGHGGEEASEHCAQRLHENVLQSQLMPHDLLTSLQDGFLRTDAQLLHHASLQPRGKMVGTAAVVMVATADHYALAHAGDCRAILVKRSGASPAFVELTNDHTAECVKRANGSCTDVPARPDEARRVERAGAHMDCLGGNVVVGDHTLPMTRALGDLPLKVAPQRSWREASAAEQVVTALPDVALFPREDDDLCVVLASDGLFGSVMSSDAVASLAQTQLEEVHASAPDKEKQTARCLADTALNEGQGTDNVSVIVVNLSPRTAHSGAPRASNVEAVPSDALSLAGLSASPTLHANLAGLAPVFVGDEVTTYADNYAARGPFPVAPHPLMLREDSILTADPCSPGRVALRDKLRMRFADAYPPEEGKENVA